MPRPSEMVSIHITRAQGEALDRRLSREYLGYTGDDGSVRALLTDIRQALAADPEEMEQCACRPRANTTSL
jgi:hypothetical protein